MWQGKDTDKNLKNHVQVRNLCRNNQSRITRNRNSGRTYLVLLADRGMYPSQIAVHIHKTKRAVNYMISNFRERMEGGKMLRIYWENIRKSLGNN